PPGRLGPRPRPGRRLRWRPVRRRLRLRVSPVALGLRVPPGRLGLRPAPLGRLLRVPVPLRRRLRGLVREVPVRPRRLVRVLLVVPVDARRIADGPSGILPPGLAPPAAPAHDPRLRDGPLARPCPKGRNAGG